MTDPVVAPAGEPISATGLTFEVKEWAHGPMDGPPLHVHHCDDEAWHVLDGTLTFRFSDRTAQAPAGSTVFVPAGVAHTFGCAGDVRYLIISTARVFSLIEALHEPGAADEAEIYRRFDSDIVE